jgi:DNA-binding MarR family transcriptional regulator
MAKTEASDKSPPASPEELVSRLRVLTRSVQDFLVARAREQGLGSTDFLALIRVTAGEEVTGAQLARAFAMRSSSVTGLVDRLEAKGLIARRPHPTDRRTVVLHATRRGQRIVTRALGPLLESLTAISGELNSNDRATVSAFLDGIGAALGAAVNE